MDFANTHEQAMRGNTGASALYAVFVLAGVGAALLFGGACGAALFGLSATELILVVIGMEFGLATKSLGYRREDEANSTTAVPAH